MKTWTIGKRIAFGFSVVLLLFAGVAVASFLLLQEVKTQSNLVIKEGLEGVTTAAHIRSNTSESQLDVLRHLLAKTVEEKKEFEARISGLKQSTDRLYADYDQSITKPEARELFNQLKEARAAYIEAREPVLSLSREGKQAEASALSATSLRAAYNTYEKKSEALFDWNEKQGHLDAEASTRVANLTSKITLSVATGAILFGTFMAVLIIRGLSKQLSLLAALLDDGSAQVSSAASQVASSSQELAEKASEQAASLEEASASLEEMSSMTKRNATDSENAMNLAGQTRSAADTGAADMETMTHAMAGIKSASDNIGKIIQTIDEIAFQTNILALNAAVEAARAGEAGMGFAVVAEEVRNLAQRSAVAAKEVADKIEDSITKSEQGVEVSAKVANSLTEIVGKARHVSDLVTQIASASKEQNEGINQINVAVTQMDDVTQSNAAGAEESASAAEELNAQAASMSEAVGQLLRLVGRRSGAAQKGAESSTPINRTGVRNGGAVLRANSRFGTEEHHDSKKQQSLPEVAQDF